MLPRRLLLTVWINSGMAPVLVTFSGYVVESVTLDSPLNGSVLRLHKGKLPRTKSERVAVGDCEERVSARKLEKHPCRPKAVRSTPSSRNSPGAGLEAPLLLVYDQGTLMGAPLTIAKVSPLMGLPLLRATRPPV